MKKNQLSNIYGENVILPPPLEGEDEEIVPPSRVPVIKDVDMDRAERDQKIIDEIQKIRQQHLDKTKHKRDIDDLTQKIKEYENEMLPQRKTEIPPESPEAMSQRPTLHVASRLFGYFEKYSAPPPKTVMLPGPEEVEDESVYKAVLPHQRKNTGNEEEDLLLGLRPQKLSPFLQRNVLEEGEDSLDPEVLPFFGESKTKDVGEDVLENLRQVQEDMAPKDKPSEEIQSTVPPKRGHNSPDDILKLCSKYHDLCCKL